MRKNTDTGRFGSPFSATDLAARLGRYGFTECSTLQAFILCICGDPPGPPELGYIRLKLRECLSRHDDGSAWFADLREAERRVSAVWKATSGQAARPASHESRFYPDHIDA
ncbi:hypothetical protein [Pantoea ananatis]|uniref:hypothetical protein n=1 Tax=Pantoea ananas TaxID=553 RepID=UPI003015E758